jgi:hypothetical protein
MLCVQVHGQAAGPPVFTDVALKDLSFFKAAPARWKLASDVSYAPDAKYKTNLAAGTGVLLHAPAGAEADKLTSAEDFGDLAIEFSFMLSRGAEATVYLQGRYGIRLSDSWGNSKSALEACGSVLQSPNVPTAFAAPPTMNASRAPGLWQRMQILFEAPKLDGKGKKTSNAVFVKVLLNGVMLYENLELEGPSKNSPAAGEAPTGPLVFASSSAVAFKDIRYAVVRDSKSFTDLFRDGRETRAGERPIIVTPTQKTIVQRCFIEYDDHKKTFCAAVGEPAGVHYAMDLSQGAVINFWKGGFIDATSMWTDRGEYQVAEPVGSKIEVAPSPVLAVLANATDAWPDLKAADFRFKGYRLATNGRPTFLYQIGDMQIEDSVAPDANDNGLTRSLSVATGKVPANLWLRLAAAETITQLGDDMYVVGDHQYYIKHTAGKKYKPVTRKSANGQELLIPGAALNDDFKYTIIW